MSLFYSFFCLLKISFMLLICFVFVSLVLLLVYIRFIYIFDCSLLLFSLFFSLCVYLSVFVCFCLRGLICSFPFFFSFLAPWNLQDAVSLERVRSQSLRCRTAKSRILTVRELPASGNTNQQELPQRSPSQYQDMAPLMASKLQCCTPHGKQLARQEHRPLISRQVAQSHNNLKDTP